MSWQEGDGPAPEPPDRPLGADEHMSLAQGYLAAAEKLRAELVATDPTDEPFDDRIVARITRVRNTSSTLLYSAIDLANAHRAMAVALRDSVPQRIEMRSPFDPDETDRAIREQLAADTEAHQSVTHAPGIDPEPEGSEGDLWTTDGEWFWYAVANHGSDERWIQARYYAHILTWQAAGTRPTPLRWEELRNEDLTGEPDMILRRPTADERSRFYGPEPDPKPVDDRVARFERGEGGGQWLTQPVPDGQGGQVDASATVTPAPEGPIRFDATVGAFGDDALAEMARAVEREQARRSMAERTRRAYTSPERR